MKRFLAYLFFVTFGIASLSAGEVETAFSPDGKKSDFHFHCQKTDVRSILWIAVNCLRY